MSEWSLFGQALINGILKSGLYALAATGMALAFGVVRILNLAHGDFLMLAAYFAVFLFTRFGGDPLAVIPAAFLLFFGLGAVVYRGVIRPVLQAGELNQLLLTFGLSIFIQNVVLILFGGNVRTIFVPYRAATISLGDLSFGAGRLLTFLLAVLLLLALYFVLQRTRFGRAVRAVGQNPEGASLIGIEPEKINLCAFGIATGFAAVAGMMLSVILYAEPLIGMGFTMKSLAVVVVAGLGNIYGVFGASLLLGVAESLVSTFVPEGTGWSEAIFFVLIFLALIFKPRGVREA